MNSVAYHIYYLQGAEFTTCDSVPVANINSREIKKPDHWIGLVIVYMSLPILSSLADYAGIGT